MEQNKIVAVSRRRCIVAVILLLAITAGLVLRLMNFQLVNGEKYLATAQRTTVKTIPIEAPRGEILDRYGRALAVNRTVYCVQLDTVFMPAEERNDIILRLINMIEDEGEEYFDELPVSERFPYSFSGSDAARIRMKSVLGLDKAPDSANVVMSLLKERYGIPDSFTEEQARKVCGVRYTMELRGAGAQTPYIFAQDIGVGAVTAVKENSSVLSGCDIVTRAVREYYYSDAAPDVVGIVGIIDEDELEQLGEKGYSATDYVGKFGLEKSMEEYLRGEAGEMQVTLNSRGQVIESKVTKEPVPGATVVITMDIELQRTAGRLLKARIEEIAEDAGESGNGYDCSAGSMVLTDPNTGEVIVAVNYPSYDLASYYEDYSQLLSAEDNPLFNRAMSGLYPPGSVFKPVTAIAGLESGVITKTSTHTCRRTITYMGRSYSCTGYHGTISVVTAIAKSCNVFFYNVGISAGIDSIGQAAESFGFGQTTGVEIAEAAGTVSQSNLLMTAIGQADTQATPLQLSAYTASIANGGTRYRSTLIRAVMSEDFSETLVENEPQVLGKINASAENMAIISEGMYSGINKRLASYYTYFVDADYIAAGKTGTVQLPSGSNNGMFICFAPYESPEAALSIALEHAGSGSRCAPLARQMMDEFFRAKDSADEFFPSGSVM